jgi:hypothetical protein
VTGIDISHHQKVFPEGDWDFVVVKATEAIHHVDERFHSHWDNAARFPLRGMFHYARPLLGSAGTQVEHFAETALGRGFRPGIDMWQLDVETAKNESVTNDQWRGFINDFMPACLDRLGRFGFLYIGMDLYPHVFPDFTPLHSFNWWLPAYGKNDGRVHPFDDNVPVDLVVIHQFTSVTTAGVGLDQNRIVNQDRWNALVHGTASMRSPQPSEDDDMRLIPRRAVAHPSHSGRIGYIKFDPNTKTLTSFNGIDFDRHTADPHVWKFAQLGDVVTAQLQLPVRGPLSYAETPDGRAVVITDDHDGGTFALPYLEVAPG